MLYMSTAQTWQTTSLSSAATFEIGGQLGRNCRGGELIVLSSDLGGGKTTFTKGLARGLQSTAVVNSPTFMVERVYPCRDNISLHHFDFYRLTEGGTVARELGEVLEDPKALIVVEWGDIVSEILPIEHIKIVLERQANNEDARHITITYPKKFAYVFEGLE
jgi:tRNA threonylcarbamoyladenosine biosynthesis protein TsaE